MVSLLTCTDTNECSRLLLPNDTPLPHSLLINTTNDIFALIQAISIPSTSNRIDDDDEVRL